MDRREYDWTIYRTAVVTALVAGATKSSIGEKVPQQRPIEHSLYWGRVRLGRYVQIRKRFRAFDAQDRPLGSFRIRARALAAIRKAWAMPK